MTAGGRLPKDGFAGPDGDQLGDVARAILAHRRWRTTMLPAEMFGEWAWDALLELFVADAEGRQLTGQMLADMLACPPQTMIRWIRYLLATDMVVSDDGPDLRHPLTLTPHAVTVLERYLAATRDDAKRVLLEE